MGNIAERNLQYALAHHTRQVLEDAWVAAEAVATGGSSFTVSLDTVAVGPYVGASRLPNFIGAELTFTGGKSIGFQTSIKSLTSTVVDGVVVTTITCEDDIVSTVAKGDPFAIYYVPGISQIGGTAQTAADWTPLLQDTSTSSADTAAAIGTPEDAVPTRAIMIAGSDGTDLRAASTDSLGNLGSVPYSYQSHQGTTLQNAATGTGDGTTLTLSGMSTVVLTVTVESGQFMVANIQVQVSPDGVNFYPYNVGWNTSGTTFATPGVITTNGIFAIDVTGMLALRAAITSYTQGTITVVGTPSMSQSGVSQRPILITDLRGNAVSLESGTFGDYELVPTASRGWLYDNYQGVERQMLCIGESPSGIQPSPYSAMNAVTITTATTTTVKSNAGVLGSIYNGSGVATGTITIYDNTSAALSPLWVGTLAAGQVLPLGYPANTGITVVTAAADTITVTYD